MKVTAGTRLGPYEIESRIGAGGMGEVWRARDTRLDRSVAVKLLLAEFAANPQLKQRFEREARAISKLNHPNICTLHDVGDGYLVMELIEGESLAQRIARGPLALKEVLAYGAQMAEALDRAHRAGIVHRDLKPGNVMITATGVKLLDFGLAHLTEARSSGTDARTAARSLTADGTVVGTLQYMPPEQLEGRDTDARTDIFAFGCVLYEMLTGRRAFEGPSKAAIIGAIMSSEPAPLSSVQPHAPPALQDLIVRCLAKDPDDRWQSAHEVAGQLRWISAGGPPLVVEPPEPERRPLARSRYIGALVVLFALACVALVVHTGMRRPVPDSETAVSPPPLVDVQASVTHANAIAVLPFENLGASEDAYFAAGMTDELISRLAAVKSLRVLSRTSVVEYDRHGKTARQIGLDLGVAYIIEGTVQWEKRKQGDRVRVAPRLIRATDDTHLWSDRFDRELDSVFDIQSEIGKKVAEELGVTLMQEEQQVIRARPTRNMEAYDLFLQANAASEDATYWTTEWRRGVALYEKATRLDPAFVAAHAGLGQAHLVIYHYGQDRRPERLVLARTSIDRALALDANSPDAHTTLAYFYYWGFLDYPSALGELAIARRLRPNSKEVVLAMGVIARRRGQFEPGLAFMNEARELDPRDGNIHMQIGITLQLLRRHAEADRSFVHAVAIDPSNSSFKRNQLTNRIAWQGKARDLSFLVAPLENREDMEATWGRFEWAILSRDYTRAVSILEESRIVHFAISRHYGAASRQPRELLLAKAYALAENRETASKSFEAARATLETWLKEQPDDPRMLSALALAEAGLGRSREAVEHAERSVDLYPISNDALLGACRLEELAVVYAAVGESAKAIDVIEQLLSIPSKLTVRLLELDPTWDSLRENPRFIRIIAAGGKA